MAGEVRTVSISRSEVLSISEEILQLVGTPKEYALSVAESLVQAQEVGHASHGIIRLLEYTDSVKRKVIDPEIRPTIFRDEGATAVIDSHWGWGQIACKYAVDVVSKKAKEFGIGIVSIKDCNHIGRVGEYVELLAAQNLISMMWCNADPAVAAYGGKDRLFGTNPLAVGIPSNDEPVVIDFATAASAEGKLRVARANGSSIPLGTVIDKGIVEVVDNLVDQTTGTIKLKARFPNAQLALWPGQFINVTLHVGTLKDTVIVPTPAIQRGPSGAFIYVVDDQSKVSVRVVKTVRQTESDSAIESGIEIGETIVTSGFNRLSEGATVRVDAATIVPTQPAKQGKGKKPATAPSP